MDGFENRYAMWLKRLDEWCLKHGVTRGSAMSILSGDGEGVTRESLYWAEWRDFVKASHEFSGERGEASTRLAEAEEILAELSSGYWVSILDGADDPVPQRLGQRVLAYWKR